MGRTRRIFSQYITGAIIAGTLIGSVAGQATQAAGVPPTSTKATPTTSAATPRPPRLNYQTTTLSNGLKVVLLEDHHAPVVTLQVWYHVGSKDEPKGKFGFAHLFEHLMFKGSKNVPPEGHARYVEQVGGDYNANTYFDRTLFFETVPVNALNRVLFLEADRMASLKVDDANFHSERHVVEEELRMDVLNAPYGHLEDIQLALLYPAGQPYAHSTIGSIPDLESASLATVKAFHDTYYKPDNATLVLVGDFQSADALARIKRYFGAIPPRGSAFPRIPYAAGSLTLPAGSHRSTKTDPLAPLPLVVIGYRMPPPTDPDTPVFDLIAGILGHGNSSRLYRSLVVDQQISTSPGADASGLKLGGFFNVDADVIPGKSPAVVEAALKAQLDRLRTTPVSPDELLKSRNQALTGLVFGSVTTEQIANRLGEADLMYGTPEEANREFTDITRVTAADIQRVARKYLAPEKAVTITIVPPAAPTAPTAPTTPAQEGK